MDTVCNDTCSNIARGCQSHYVRESKCIRTMKLMKFFAEFKIKKHVLGNNPQKLAVWVKKRFIEMGPTFVKVGQLISTRSDIFNKEFALELQSLQDHAPPFDVHEVKRIIEKELRCPLYEIFEEFEDDPIGVASIGQVHRAKLKNGDVVVVKVKRPNVKECIEDDYKCLCVFLNVACFFGYKESSDAKIIITDLYESMMSEVSFKNELENILTFIDNSFGENVRIPTPYVEYCTDDILTLEYIPSTKLTNIKDSKIAYDIMSFFMRQLFKYGVVHADPHPGNIGITDKNTLVLYDFGHVLRLDPEFIFHVKDLLYSIHTKDIDRVCDLMVRAKLVKLLDENSYDTLHFVMEQIIKYMNELRHGRLDSTEACEMINEYSTDRIEVNGKCMLLIRCTTLLEGVCKSLDEDFCIGDVIGSVIREIFIDDL